MPPRPAGVAMATIVSSGENITEAQKIKSLQIQEILLTFCKKILLGRCNGDGLHRRVADAFGRNARYFGDGEMDEPSLVRVQWADALFDAGVLRLLREERRHLP